MKKWISARTINMKEMNKIFKFSTMEEVYFKAKRVIDSCDSISQKGGCERYIKQFYKVYNDERLYKRLTNRLNEKFPFSSQLS